MRCRVKYILTNGCFQASIYLLEVHHCSNTSSSKFVHMHIWCNGVHYFQAQVYWLLNTVSASVLPSASFLDLANCHYVWTMTHEISPGFKPCSVSSMLCFNSFMNSWSSNSPLFQVCEFTLKKLNDIFQLICIVSCSKSLMLLLLTDKLLHNETPPVKCKAEFRWQQHIQRWMPYHFPRDQAPS